MPSYTQYKRQLAVLDADDSNIESWITVKGNHIPIMKGQSKEDAVKSFLEKKGQSTGAKSEPKSNKQVFYKNISGKQIGSPKGRTFIENEIMTEKEMAKRGFDPTDKRFERKELGKNEHHFFFGARFENQKEQPKEQTVQSAMGAKWTGVKLEGKYHQFSKKEDAENFIKEAKAHGSKESDIELVGFGGEKENAGGSNTNTVNLKEKETDYQGQKIITYSDPEGRSFRVWESSNDPGWKASNRETELFNTKEEALEAAKKQYNDDMEKYGNSTNKRNKIFMANRYPKVPDSGKTKAHLMYLIGSMDKWGGYPVPDGDDTVRQEVGGELPFWHKEGREYRLEPNVGWGSENGDAITKKGERWVTREEQQSFNSLKEAAAYVEKTAYESYLDYFSQFEPGEELEREIKDWELTPEEESEVRAYLAKQGK